MKRTILLYASPLMLLATLVITHAFIAKAQPTPPMSLSNLKGVKWTGHRIVITNTIQTVTIVNGVTNSVGEAGIFVEHIELGIAPGGAVIWRQIP